MFEIFENDLRDSYRNIEIFENDLRDSYHLLP